MDRNISCSIIGLSKLEVALRKESVDRNNSPISHDIIPHFVALRKESVDRNAKIMSVSNG